MDTKSENVSSGYSLEAALSNVNDSDEYSQLTFLTFFREIYRKHFINLQAYSTSNSEIIQMLFTYI